MSEAACVDHRDFLRTTANLPTDGSARDVTSDGVHLYLADGTAGLVIASLDDPAWPRVVATEPSVGNATQVAHLPGHVVVASDDATLHVVDVTDPSQPTPIATIGLPDTALDLAIAGPLLLVAAGTAGLLVIDLADPANPTLIGALDTPGLARGVASVGNRAAIADDTGVVIVDLTAPAQPQLLGRLETPARGIALADDGIVLATSDLDGLEVIAITPSGEPSSLAVLPLPGLGRRVDRTGDLALLSTSVGLCVVDIADPVAPRLVGRASTTAGALALTSSGPWVYLACGNAGLDVVDADPPTSPGALAEVSVRGVAFGVATAGNLTFLGADDLEIIDHSDLTAPRLLATVPFVGTTSRVATDGVHTYITGANEAGGSLLIVDIADAALLATLPVDGFVSSVCVGQNAVYLADFFFGGLFTVDVSSPAQPQVADTDATRPYAQQLALAGPSHLLVGTGAFGDGVIQVFDVATPLDPQLVAELSVDARGLNGLAVDGPLACATLNLDGNGALLVLDATDPTALVEIAVLPLPDELHGVVLEDGVAYVTCLRGAVHVVDLSDPASPVWLGQNFVGDSAFVLALSDDAVHLAATDAGLALLPRQCSALTAAPAAPTDARALRAFPNPFNPRVTLSFTLPRAAVVAVAVYDVAGRHVADVWRGPLGAGPHRLTWDGVDGRGRFVASGRYLARLTGGVPTRTAIVTLVR